MKKSQFFILFLVLVAHQANQVQAMFGATTDFFSKFFGSRSKALSKESEKVVRFTLNELAESTNVVPKSPRASAALPKKPGQVVSSASSRAAKLMKEINAKIKAIGKKINEWVAAINNALSKGASQQEIAKFKTTASSLQNEIMDTQSLVQINTTIDPQIRNSINIEMKSMDEFIATELDRLSSKTTVKINDDQIKQLNSPSSVQRSTLTIVSEQEERIRKALDDGVELSSELKEQWRNMSFDTRHERFLAAAKNSYELREILESTDDWTLDHIASLVADPDAMTQKRHVYSKIKEGLMSPLGLEMTEKKADELLKFLSKIDLPNLPKKEIKAAAKKAKVEKAAQKLAEQEEMRKKLIKQKEEKQQKLIKDALEKQQKLIDNKKKERVKKFAKRFKEKEENTFDAIEKLKTEKQLKEAQDMQEQRARWIRDNPEQAEQLRIFEKVADDKQPLSIAEAELWGNFKSSDDQVKMLVNHLDATGEFDVDLGIFEVKKALEATVNGDTTTMLGLLNKYSDRDLKEYLSDLLKRLHPNKELGLRG
jgi:hypothetical protein